MLYRYKAIFQERHVSGTIAAESLEEAKQTLLKQAIFLVQIRELKQQSSSVLLNKKEVLYFTKELARLLRAGLPLYDALSAMEEKYRGHKSQTLLLNLCEHVRGGTAFSTALAGHKATFGLLFPAMAATAEKTGNLAGALEELSRLLAKQAEVRKQMLNALLYPSFLLGFCFLVLSVLLFYVVPSLQELFEGRALHPMTQIVFSMSRFVCGTKEFLAAGIVGILGLGLVAAGSPKRRAWMHTQILRLPLVRQPLLKGALIRFCRAASTLLEGGLPIVEAFSQARSVVRHPALEHIIQQAETAISQGKPVQAPFRDQKLIPPLVPRMLGIAQESGNLPSMLRQIAEVYEEELERGLAYFSTIAQPALLLFLGAVVGFILLSVLIPLTDVSSLTAN